MRMLLLGAVLSASTIARAQQAPHQPFERGMVTLAFDDAWDTQIEMALPVLRSYGYVGVFYVTTQALEEDWRGFMTVEQAQQLLAEGHAVESHSVSHPVLPYLSDEDLLHELKDSQAWLWKSLGTSAGHHIAAPFGMSDERVVNAMRGIYASHRTVALGRNYRDSDVMRLASYDVHSRVTLGEVEDWLLQAHHERSWIILTFHEFVHGPTVRNTELDVDDFDNILAAIEQLDMPVVSLEDGIEQMQQSTTPCEACAPEPTPSPTPMQSTIPSQQADAGGCHSSQADLWVVVLLALLFTKRRAWLLALLHMLACGSQPIDPSPLDPSDNDDDGIVVADIDPTDTDSPAAAIQVLGRTDNPEAPVLAWPGTRVVARFEGTQVAVSLNELALPWQEGGPSELDVRIDNVWQDKLVMQGGTHTYVLSKDLAPGQHQVEIYRRSEAQNGTTEFLGFDFGDGELLAPPQRSQRRIEVIGDSASSGFGVEGVEFERNCPGPDWAARYQNFRKAWGARVGVALDAEVNATVYSGKGIVKNIWRQDKVTMPRLYPRANPLNSDSTFDASQFSPHVILLMMGGNDFAFGQPVDDGLLSENVFAESLAEFVDDLRALHPNAHVVLVVSPSTPKLQGSRPLRTLIKNGMKQVFEKRQNLGDALVHLVEPTPAVEEELTGCNGHGTPAFHQRVADEIADYVRALLNW